MISDLGLPRLHDKVWLIIGDSRLCRSAIRYLELRDQLVLHVYGETTLQETLISIDVINQRVHMLIINWKEHYADEVLRLLHHITPHMNRDAQCKIIFLSPDGSGLHKLEATPAFINAKETILLMGIDVLCF